MHNLNHLRFPSDNLALFWEKISILNYLKNKCQKQFHYILRNIINLPYIILLI